MTGPPVLLNLADEQYVLLTTTRRSGVTVGTAVWVVRHEDALLVTTGSESGKVKRIRHTPSVTVQACDRAGRPVEGAPVIEAHASIHTDDESRSVIDATLRGKYGVQYAAIRAMGGLRRRKPDASVVVQLEAP